MCYMFFIPPSYTHTERPKSPLYVLLEAVHCSSVLTYKFHLRKHFETCIEFNVYIHIAETWKRGNISIIMLTLSYRREIFDTVTFSPPWFSWMIVWCLSCTLVKYVLHTTEKYGDGPINNTHSPHRTARSIVHLTV